MSLTLLFHKSTWGRPNTQFSHTANGYNFLDCAHLEHNTSTKKDNEGERRAFLASLVSTALQLLVRLLASCSPGEDFSSELVLSLLHHSGHSQRTARHYLQLECL